MGIRWQTVLLLVAVLVAAFAAGGAGVFLWTHPQCATCGRRFGPLVPHTQRHAPTTKIGGGSSRMMRAQIARARATAPVINSLPPVTNANRNLKLTPEYLAGRWEAQDGSRAPVTFTADGKVEYAMFRRQGAWQMATGKYEIKAGQVHVSASSGQAGISMRFKFARGVLYAPKGPSPQVVWKRVGK